LLVQTMFTAKTSTLLAKGEYGFNGVWSAGYSNGSWTVSGPAAFAPKWTLADSMGGASLGVNGLVFGYGARVIVGIGAYGFVTGPFAGVTTIVGLTRGSDLSIGMAPVCRSSILDMSMKVGVGWSIPHPVAGVINFIFRQLHIKEIDESGGPGYEKPLYHVDQKVPDGCAGGSAS
jgi:hypothetical protein